MTPIVGNIKDVDVVADCLDRYGSDVLDVLLKDRTTGRNIIWADDEYVRLGEGYGAYDEITVEKISAGKLIEPRVAKAVEQQAWRTREKAEVFTPSWLCKKMVDCLDDAFFGSELAGFEDRNNTGLTAARYGQLAEAELWKDYVNNRLLEITCGEAPFVCSPYVATTGEFVPVEARVGFLDRKLNVVTRFAGTYDEWFEWAVRAVQATYGYEYQGDNLLIARINVLNTIADFMRDVWEKDPGDYESMRVADVISWNLWQMDGLRGCVPSEWDLPPDPCEEEAQMSLFDMGFFEEEVSEEEHPQAQMQFAERCVIYDWHANALLPYKLPSEGVGDSMKKFYGVIGNPPYQEQAPGESTSDKPIYHKFMDASYEVGEKVELITPARFLFNAGGTPKAWNKKMLESEHVKVVRYEQKAQDVFPTTTFTGGIAVTMFDETAKFHPIGQFTPYAELNSMRQKICQRDDFESMSSIISKRNEYLFTEAMHRDYPYAVDRLSAGHPNDIASDIFSSLPEIFYDIEPGGVTDYLRVLGRFENKRTYRWILRRYIKERVPYNLGKWKVFLPKANGASGTLGDEPARMISKPVLGEPFDVAAETFVSVGSFDTKAEADALMKYFDGRFARALLGILKVTQDNTSEKWAYVPLQDFSVSSDIDWTQNPFAIDKQLYEKYGLTQNEIDFVENHIAPLREG